MLAHPPDHPADDSDCEERDDGLEAFLLALWQLLVDDVERDADADADCNSDPDPKPGPLERVAPTFLAKEGRDDPHDERGLDALAQADNERWQHDEAAC